VTTGRYAAYGSNLHPLRLRKRVASASLVGTAALDGYEMRFNKTSDVDGTGKCSINPGKGPAYVAVYEMDLADKAILDAIEGVGSGYNEIHVNVPGVGRCWTYVADASVIDEALAPTDWYREIVLLGCRYHAFPEAYVKAIERIDAIIDPDKARGAENWALVEMLRAGR